MSDSVFDDIHDIHSISVPLSSEIMTLALTWPGQCSVQWGLCDEKAVALPTLNDSPSPQSQGVSPQVPTSNQREEMRISILEMLPLEGLDDSGVWAGLSSAAC